MSTQNEYIEVQTMGGPVGGCICYVKPNEEFIYARQLFLGNLYRKRYKVHHHAGIAIFDSEWEKLEETGIGYQRRSDLQPTPPLRHSATPPLPSP